MTQEQMIQRHCQLTALNEQRRGMLSKLYCLGKQFPDPDLRDAFEEIKAETERRIERTAKRIDDLETIMEAEEVSA